MKRVLTRDHAPARFFVYRTPLLPWQVVRQWSDGLTGAPDKAEEELSLSRERLRRIADDPVVREAIFLASPDLDAAIGEWLKSSTPSERLERAVGRYVCRMATRCTPFGLFAGWTTGVVGDALALPIVAGARHTRLDMDFLVALADALGRDPRVRGGAVYRPNSSIARFAGKVRFAQSRLQGRKRQHCLIVVDETPHLLAALEAARGGARFERVAAAVAVGEVTYEAAAGFVDQLIDEQLLVSDLVPAITGTEPLEPLIEATRVLAPEVAAPLEAAAVELRALDAEPLGVDPRRYRDLAARLEGLPVEAGLDRLFQVDMVRAAAGATLDSRIADDIADAVEVFHRVTQPFEDPALARFREAFERRYGDAEVPLLVALDEEIGAGFGAGSELTPLLDGIASVGTRNDADVPLRARDMVLIRRVLEVVSRGEHELRLDDEDVRALTPQRLPPLPQSFAVLASFTEQAMLVERLSGPSGAFALGRFAHADEPLRQHLEEYLRQEEAARPDAVFAEVVHLPEGRIGNIILRPRLREHEIAFLGRGGAGDAQTIALDDLFVSVADGRILLRSCRLGREVVPRMTSAHSFGAGALGLYRFLCLLQSQGLHTRYEWTWGALRGAPFLPRVSYGRWTFARAQWLLDRQELETLGGDTPRARAAAAAALRERRGLPQTLLLADGDNELFVDFANPITVDNLVHLTRGRSMAQLSEIFPPPEESLARGAGGTYRTEVVVPFTPRSVPASSRPPLSAAPRSFPLGSEWLFVKLYCGNAAADRLLRETLAPLVSSLLREQAIDRWFFIRYSDPDWHIRLRLHGRPAQLLADVLPRLSAALEPLAARGDVQKIVYDPYEPEIARYGGEAAMAEVERIFRADSEAVVRLLAVYTGDAGLDARWRLCLKGIDMLLDDLGFDLAGRASIVAAARESLGRELDPGAALKERLAVRLRREKRFLEALFDSARLPDDLRRGVAILEARSPEVREAAARLRALARDGELTRPLDEIAGSLVHMFANRLLRSAQRMQELVLYDFLDRTYRSRRARPAATSATSA